MKKLCSLFLLVPWMFSGCAQTPPASRAPKQAVARYDDMFDAWRANSLALEPAKQGDRDALIAFFLSAYVRMSEPYMGGEDLEQMIDNHMQLLKALGDDAFCKALEAQRPEVRSAAGWFLQSAPGWFADAKRTQPAYPKTSRLLQKASKIDWPVNKAYRDSR